MTALRASFTDVYSSALRGESCRVVGLPGTPRPLPVGTWTRQVDAADEALLARCVGATLDIGCGPGRMTEYLAARGHTVLGVDLVPEAVAQTRDRGASALQRNVFEPLPGEGRWDTVLLADGNIGIDGDPVALLTRAAELLERSGRVVTDLAAPGVPQQVCRVRLETGSHHCRPFSWAIVGTDAIEGVALRSGLRVAEIDRYGDRWFAVLTAAA